MLGGSRRPIPLLPASPAGRSGHGVDSWLAPLCATSLVTATAWTIHSTGPTPTRTTAVALTLPMVLSTRAKAAG
ncbi:hypothetical protein BH20ACT2_BH20ACT2_06160 [soil metagenome]